MAQAWRSSEVEPRSPRAGCKGGVPGCEGMDAPPGGTEYFRSIVDISHSLFTTLLFFEDDMVSKKTKNKILSLD